MEKELRSDLADALEGIDVVKLLTEDSELFPVAQEIWNILDNYNDGSDDSEEKIVEDLDVAHTNAKTSTSTSANASSEEDPVSRTSQPKTRVLKPNCPCQVCHKPAKGYKYFGVRVCYGCRAFFARSVKNKTYLKYECCGDSGNCFDDTVAWINCQRCRFAKCLEYGMAIQSKSIYSKVDMAKKLLKEWGVKGASRRLLIKARIDLSPTCLLTLDEKLNIESYTSQVLCKSYKNMVTLMGNDMNIYKSSLELYYLGRHFPLLLQKSVQKYLHYAGSRDFLENCDNQFNKLTIKDKSRLVAGNIEMASEFLDAYRLDKREQLSLEVQSFIDSMKNIVNEEHAQAVDKIYSEVTQNGQLKPKVMTFDMVYDADSLGLDTEESLRNHRLAVSKLSRLGTGVSKDWDPVHVILTVSIIMFCTDFVDLDDRGEAERVQMIYIRLLYRYLKHKGDPDSDWIFRESLMASTYARQLQEVRQNAFRKIKT